jgi:hypothetical protein
MFSLLRVGAVKHNERTYFGESSINIPISTSPSTAALTDGKQDPVSWSGPLRVKSTTMSAHSNLGALWNCPRVAKSLRHFLVNLARSHLFPDRSAFVVHARSRYSTVHVSIIYAITGSKPSTRSGFGWMIVYPSVTRLA